MTVILFTSLSDLPSLLLQPRFDGDASIPYSPGGLLGGSRTTSARSGSRTDCHHGCALGDFGGDRKGLWESRSGQTAGGLVSIDRFSALLSYRRDLPHNADLVVAVLLLDGSCPGSIPSCTPNLISTRIWSSPPRLPRCSRLPVSTRPWIQNLNRFTIPCESDARSSKRGVAEELTPAELPYATYSMVLKWMFPGGKSLPHVVVSHNARFDPVSRANLLIVCICLRAEPVEI